MQSIKIPKYLQELHGKRSSLISLVLVYTNALLFALFFLYKIQPLDLAVWKSILLLILVADIAGGAVANFTTSTRQYYKDNKNLQLPFLLMHIIHPVLLFVVLPDFLSISIFMALFTLAAVLIVKLFANNQDLKVIAVFLFGLGASITLLLPCTGDFLRIIPILFFLKLILGFAVGVFEKKE